MQGSQASLSGRGVDLLPRVVGRGLVGLARRRQSLYQLPLELDLSRKWRVGSYVLP